MNNQIYPRPYNLINGEIEVVGNVVRAKFDQVDTQVWLDVYHAMNRASPELKRIVGNELYRRLGDE